MNRSGSKHRQKIERESQRLLKRLRQHVDKRGRLCVIKAPPGSGKTYTLIQAVLHAFKKRKERVAVAAQTNAQCDDICRRLASTGTNGLYRFAASGTSAPEELQGKVHWTTDKGELSEHPCIVVGTTAKWSLIDLYLPFDFLFVDEAWQMTWSDFMLLGQVAPRFVLIGDPGQIPPVVTIGVERWETSPRGPHRAAPEVIIADPTVDTLALDLSASRRLPADSLALVRPFYDFPFEAWALPGERYLKPGRRVGVRDAVDLVLDLLTEGSATIATIEPPEEGPPLEHDPQIAALAARFAIRALDRRSIAVSHEDDGEQRLAAVDIGISATHRVMNSAILQALPPTLRAREIITSAYWS